MNLLNGITGLRKEPAPDAENSQPGALDLLGEAWDGGLGLDLLPFGVWFIWLYNVFLKLSKQNVKKKVKGLGEAQRHKRIITDLTLPDLMQGSRPCLQTQPSTPQNLTRSTTHPILPPELRHTPMVHLMP